MEMLLQRAFQTDVPVAVTAAAAALTGAKRTLLSFSRKSAYGYGPPLSWLSFTSSEYSSSYSPIVSAT